MKDSDKTDLMTKVNALKGKSSLLSTLKPCNSYCTGGSSYNIDKNECDESTSSYNTNIASISDDLTSLMSNVTTIPKGAKPASGGQPTRECKYYYDYDTHCKLITDQSNAKGLQQFFDVDCKQMYTN